MEHKHHQHNHKMQHEHHEKASKMNMDHDMKDMKPDHTMHGKHAGHDPVSHHKMMIADFRLRFFVSLIVTIPILILSPFVQQLLNYSVSFTGDVYVLFACSSFVFFYGGWPFLKGFFSEFKQKTPGMMTLISVAISVAYIYSAAVVFGLEGKFFFWELATLVDVMLLGHWIEMRSVLSASNALEKLKELIPDTAHLVKGNDTTDIKTSELKDGDLILIKPGEKIPSDGTVVHGESYVNEAMLTGESKPVSKTKDNEVIGGSINEDGSLTVKVHGVGDNSYLSKVVKLVRDAQMAKSKTQRLADKAAKWLTISALSIGTITLVFWLGVQPDIAFAIERAATVMVIACPHALGLAIPLVVAVSTSLSAKNGLLIRNRTAFEQSRLISTVLFDKTGTLTEGVFKVSNVKSLNKNYKEDEILTLAAALEVKSEHLIANAIVNHAKSNQNNIGEANQFEAIKGKGVKGMVNGKNIMVVSPGYLNENKIQYPSKEEVIGTTVYVLENNVLIGFISMSDSIRKESFDAIKTLKQAGIKSWMITGDNETVAKQVAEELGLDGYFAGVLPDQKQAKVKELQGNGEYVAMVGDGVNDAPALAQANVGIAIGSGTDIAAETADIILVNNNPKDVVSLIKFGKATYNKMLQNLFWATGYNIIAIPLAAGVLFTYGIIISPALGALFMSLSTVIVAINARFLKVEKVRMSSAPR